MPGRERAYPEFLRAIEAVELVEGERICIACSGGVDSVCLAHLFARFQERRRPDLELSLGHVHHGLRGKEADDAAEGCRALAEKLGWPFYETKIDVAASRQEQGGSEETVARDLRRRAYAAWASEHDLDAIGLAHHKRDQAETVLGNLLRGTGLHGLGGMRLWSPLPGSDVKLLRPLLEIDKSALLDFAAACDAEVFEDSTNRSMQHRRNRIREQLIPQLEDYNPQFIHALTALASDAREWDAWLEAQLAPALSHLQWGPDAVVLPRQTLPPPTAAPLLAALLSVIWQRLTGDRGALTRDHFDAWHGITTGAQDGHCYDLPRGWFLERAAGVVTLSRPSNIEPGRYPQESTELTTTFGLTASCVVDGPAGDTRLPEGCESGQWRLVQSDDRIRIEDGHAEISELLRAAGIPTSVRKHYPVLARGDQVDWIPGIRVAAGSRGTARGSVWVDTTTPEGFLVDAALGRRAEG